MNKYLLSPISYLLFPILFTACTKEIDFDYNEVVPVVMIEGRVTNEGCEVLITYTRNMSDSVKSPCLKDADVIITTDGMTERLPYDAATRSYRSTFCGTPGQTYHLDITLDDHHYEAVSTMPYPAPIKSAEFLWQPIMDERLLAYEVWAIDPEPDVRNYYWYRMDRYSTHPHVSNKNPSYLNASLFIHSEPYRWNVFDDRGCPPGLTFRDVLCMSEQAAKEDDEENWDSILYEGDLITFTLMTIDRPTYDFFRSMISGQNGGANPISNIKGDVCIGYFTAANITHADTIRFSYDICSDINR